MSDDSDESGSKEEVLFIDPDRPPVSISDIKKLKNQMKSKAKK
jgi:hypothetical protein